MKIALTFIFLAIAATAFAENQGDEAQLPNDRITYTNLGIDCLSELKKAEDPPAEDAIAKMGQYVAMEQKKKIVASCYENLKQENNDHDFNLLVFRELRNTRFWLDSANWLKKNNMYSETVAQLCETLPSSTLLHLLKPKYPAIASIRRLEGQFNMYIAYDVNGDFINVMRTEPSQEKIEPFLYKAAQNAVQNSRSCPSDHNQSVKIPFNFRLAR